MPSNDTIVMEQMMILHEVLLGMLGSTWSTYNRSCQVHVEGQDAVLQSQDTTGYGRDKNQCHAQNNHFRCAFSAISTDFAQALNCVWQQFQILQVFPLINLGDSPLTYGVQTLGTEDGPWAQFYDGRTIVNTLRGGAPATYSINAGG